MLAQSVRGGVRKLFLALAAAAVVVLAPRPAHAQFGMFGGGGNQMVQDTISKRGLDAYTRMLEFDKDQKEAAVALFEGHQTANRAMQKELQEKLAAMGEKARDSGDFSVYQKDMPSMMKEYTAKAEGLEKGFFADLKELCNEKQTPRWDTVQRYRRRETAMRFGFVSGSAVDLISVMEKIKAKPVNEADYKEVINQYELDIDKLLVHFETVAKASQEDLIEASSKFDMKKIEEGMKKFYEAGAQVRDVNRAAARKIEPLLGDDDKTKFVAEINKRSFPRIYKPSHAQQMLDAAAGFTDLTAEQKESLKGIKDSYQRDLTVLNEKWAKATEEKEEKAGGTIMVMIQSYSMQGGDPNDPVKVSKEARKELDDKTKEKIEAVLTPEQKSKLPQKKAEDLNPMADFMPAAEEPDDK